MRSDNLNIEENHVYLVRIAMARFRKDEQAAMALGISKRTLYRYKRLIASMKAKERGS